MSGSAAVNAKLGLVVNVMEKALEGAMDNHIKNSVSFAKSNKPWNSISGAAANSIESKTEASTTKIESVIYGDIMTNVYLEKSWFFNGRYKILEAARNNNIGMLWAAIRAIVKSGGGKFGGVH